jgi:hypothetical protein
LLGAKFYAGGMAANDRIIRGVINMDAIAYDGNGDRKARIHTRSTANSRRSRTPCSRCQQHYNIDLDLLRTDPGATYSDHAAFWTEGYGGHPGDDKSSARMATRSTTPRTTGPSTSMCPTTRSSPGSPLRPSPPWRNPWVRRRAWPRGCLTRCPHCRCVPNPTSTTTDNLGGRCLRTGWCGSPCMMRWGAR